MAREIKRKPVTRDTIAKLGAKFDKAVAKDQPIPPQTAPVAKVVTEFKPTPEQEAIYNWATKGQGNGVVIARAGTGKTSGAIVGTVKRIPTMKRVLCVAFNKSIANELATKGFGRNVFVSTLHGFCYRAIKRHFPSEPQIDGHKTTNILYVMMGSEKMTNDQRRQYTAISGPMRRVIGVMKNQGYGALRPLPTSADIFAVASEFDIQLPDNGDLELMNTLLPQVYASSLANEMVIDYDDMLLFILAKRIRVYSHDYVIVDEAQDLNRVQIEIIKRAMGDRGRAMFVGDDRQAIYLFRGADANAFQSLFTEFKSTALPLTVCWRCGRKIIELAQTIVPDIQAAPNAEEGIVRECRDNEMMAQAKAGDYILCRFTAPLVATCLTAIASGVRAMVKGRDLGENLVTLTRNVEKKIKGVGMFDALRAYTDAELEKLGDDPRFEAKRSSIIDRRDAISAIAETCSNWDEVRAKINSLFSDDEAGLVFSTVHRAKGLESDRVFIMLPEKLGVLGKNEAQQLQEKNLEYVAYTRARKELVLVQTTKKN